MRVVQVSAHYPPNFVSGGTLVPQRIARHLAELGWESFVYAGHLDESRPALETWDEVDEHGVRVHWVVTTPWTAWSDPLNSLNPDVEADAERWFAQVRPDVVHVHALQALGGGVLRAAKRSGAAVVVTMHDFWWTCARQFLMPASVSACSLVVDCGSCPCAVDHGWLERRNAALQPYLEYADQVLAPSRTAARVLIANGLAADRLQVDENGVDRIPGGAITREARDGPVRFMYAGGDDAMKGVDTLLAAARELPADGTWSLDLYGVTRDGLPDGVHGRAPFAREELGSVMAAHDVLVLPSRLRESHSILTREALQAGLAVICTESLGPEEVVEHGVTGFVVPIAGVSELAEAMGTLARDPALAPRMGDAGRGTVVRSWQDQLEGLERRYRALAGSVVDRDPLREAELALLHRVVVVVGIQGAPLRYRAQLPAEALRMRGHDVEVRHYRDPELPGLLRSADAVVLYRVPATEQVLDLIAGVRARERAVPVLFDIDDLIFDPGMEGQVEGLARLSEAEQDLWWRGVARYRTTMEQCDAYVGSTQLLCDRATELTGMPAFRYPNGVGVALARVSEAQVARPRAAGPLRIGYFSGTNTHDADWACVEDAVADVLEARPEVELWLGGLVTAGPRLDAVADRVRRLPMVRWHALPGHLRDVDVNLAPLVLGRTFNEAKSAIKWLEAALVQTPTVASPTQPFVEAVTHGRTGMLASDRAEWVAAIESLLDDAMARRRMGVLAQREALLRWGPHVQGRTYQQILLDAAAVRRAQGPRTTDWQAVADDEPLSGADAWVEPLVDPVGAVVPAAAGRWRENVRAVRRVYAAGGVREVSRRVVGRLGA